MAWRTGCLVQALVCVVFVLLECHAANLPIRDRPDTDGHQDDPDSGCVHDELAKKTQIVALDQPIERKKRQTPSFEPIRIKFHYVTENISQSASFQTVWNTTLKDSLNMAANYIQKAIQVQRLQENLRLRPNCSSISTACGSECNCGSLLNTFSCGEFVTVPQDHIGTRTVCKNSICQPDGPNGVGVSDTDLLIYVTANESESDRYCHRRQRFFYRDSDIDRLSYGSHCMLDPELNYRPVVGYINICPYYTIRQLRRMSTALALEEGKRIFIHDLLHILGFSVELFKYFRNETGGPQTLWGTESIFNHYTDQQRSLVLPTVAEIAKTHFGCQNLSGIPFSRSYSHWPRQYLWPEIMTPAFYPTYSQLSPFTLAVLKDSGWYDVNYEVTQTTLDGKAIPYIFGKGLGCSFIRGYCRDSSVNPYNCLHYYYERSPRVCSYDGLYKGYCSNVRDYFGISCLYPIPHLGQNCNSSRTQIYNPGFEVIGENSMCFMSNLNNSQLSAQCYDVETITTGSDYAYKVITGNNEGPVIYCTSTGQNVSVDEGSIACGHHEVFQTLRPPLTTVSTVPSEACHPSCGSCSRINDPSACNTCKYNNLELDGPAPNSCSSWQPECTIRLVGGTETNTTISGRVEVFVNGYWSTVCRDGWNRAAARTVCNQLGYKRLTNAYIGQGGVFGRGSGPILEGVQCSRPSTRICTCLHDSPPCGGCDHSKDVSVACSNDSLLSELIGYPFGPEYDRFTYNGYLLRQCYGRYITLLNYSLPLNGSFPYFGGLHSHMLVDALGYVWLNNGYYSHCWGPRTFPYSYYRSYSRTGHTIAAFWQYQWLTNTSAVYHQVFLRQEKETLFKEIDETIYKQTSQECSSFRFESQWALIVTWEGMRGYGRYHVPWLPDTENTFQLILATDWTFSFAIFTYPEDGLNWATDPHNRVYGIAGYNVGDGVGYLNLPGSGTENVTLLDEIEGNTGKIGQWVYRIDSTRSLGSEVACCSCTMGSCADNGMCLYPSVCPKCTCEDAQGHGTLNHDSRTNSVELPAASSWTLYPGLNLSLTFNKPQTVFVFYQITGYMNGQISSILRVNGDVVSMSTISNEFYRNLIGVWTKVVSPGTYRFEVFYKSTSVLVKPSPNWSTNIIHAFWMDYSETVSASSHLTCEQNLNTNNFWRSLDSSTASLLVPEHRVVLVLYSSSFTFPSTVSGEMFTQLEIDGCPHVQSTCSKGLITETNLFGGYAGVMTPGLHQFRLRTKASHDMKTEFCDESFGQNLAAVVLPQGCKVDKVCPESCFNLTTGNSWTNVPGMVYSFQISNTTDVIVMYQYSGLSYDSHTVLRLLFNGVLVPNTPTITGDSKYAGNFNLWYGSLTTGQHELYVQLRSPNTIKHIPMKSCTNCGWASRCLTIIQCPT